MEVSPRCRDKVYTVGVRLGKGKSGLGYTRVRVGIGL